MYGIVAVVAARARVNASLSVGIRALKSLLI